jgi:hypothetical protein
VKVFDFYKQNANQSSFNFVEHFWLILKDVPQWRLKIYHDQCTLAVWANPSFGDIVENHLEEFPKEPKGAKSFSYALSFKCFHNYNYFSHVYDAPCCNED